MDLAVRFDHGLDFLLAVVLGECANKQLATVAVLLRIGGGAQMLRLIGESHLQGPLRGMIPSLRIERERPVDLVHGTLGVLHLLVGYKGTAPMAVGVSVTNDGDVGQWPVGAKDGDEVRLGHSLGHLTDEELGVGGGW